MCIRDRNNTDYTQNPSYTTTRDGHWVCVLRWMSTGRNNGLMWITHTTPGTFNSFFFIPVIFALPCCPAPSYVRMYINTSKYLIVVTQIRGYIVVVGSSPPFRYVPCIFIPRRCPHFLSWSTRVELCPRYIAYVYTYYNDTYMRYIRVRMHFFFSFFFCHPVFFIFALLFSPS